jgi:SNF2 family DNA or RNA helicase
MGEKSERHWLYRVSRSKHSRLRTSTHTFSYTNTITGKKQMYPPPDFSGGLLGDQMGLGKTLSIIALIVSNTARLSRKRPRVGQTTAQDVKTTLIVAPMSCMYCLREGNKYSS